MRYLVLAFNILSLSLWASDANIEIQSESFVEGPTIQLHEIAKFHNLSKAQMAKLSDLALGDAPEFGEVRSFSSRAISEILRSKLEDTDLKIEIPSNIVVKNVASKIDAATLKKRISDNVKRGCGECSVEVRDVMVPVFETPSLSSTWDLTPDWSRVRGAFQIPLEISDRSGRKSTYWITGRANILAKVAIAKRNLIIGEKIHEEDIEFQERDITYNADAITDVKDAIGSQIRMTVMARGLITRSTIQKAPALVRGQNVTVRMGEGTWNVSIKGVAEQNGSVGDQVRVLNSITKKIVMGTIIADGVVEVR
jgi:flagellar basal body P-ring formation protein FlgA